MLNQPSNTQIDKILAIISFMFIIAALILISIIPSATTYEISIYDVYPSYFWILLAVPLIIPFLKIIMEEKPNFYTFIVIGAALFSIFIVLSLPLFRGYPFYGAGDTHTHLGMIKDIMMTGHIGMHNPYPIIHILITSLSNIIHISPEKISLIIPSIFLFLYIISMFLLSKSLGSSKKESLFVLLFSIVPVLGIGLTTEYIMPSLQAFLYIPLTLFIFFKSRNSEKKAEFSILLVIASILTAFFHPESMVFLTIFFVVLYVVHTLEKKLSQKYDLEQTDLIQKVYVPLLLLIVASLAWFSSTYVFGVSIQDIYSSFVLNLEPNAPPVVTLVGGFNINLFDVLTIIVKEYGVMLIYLIVSFFIALYTIKNTLKGKYDRRDFILSLLFIGFIISNLIFLTKGTSIGLHVFRQLKYPLMVSTLLLGIYFAKFLKINKNLKTFSCLVIIISFVFILPVVSLSSIYPSPSIQLFNYESTSSDIQSMGFFLDHRNEELLISELIGRSYQARLSDYLLGYEAKKINLVQGYGDITLPSHFGYSNNSQLGDYYQESRYLLVYPPSSDYYPEIYPNYKNLWKYSPEDFEMLEHDKTVNLVYSSSNFKIFIINPN